ncbi:MAG: isochorismatase family cysteine hydrolase [Thermodesulfobacteriota bacterium]
MPAAILVIDLVNDTFAHDTPISRAARAMMPALNRFLAAARRAGGRVVFSTDSFLEGDFIFRGRMKPHSIRGTKGAEVAGLIERDPGDTWLPKRRFSAFFKTDLDQTLRLWGVDLVGVCGVTTNFCVLATAFDALCHDFKAVIIEDLCAALTEEIHRTTLDNYRHNVLDPVFRVMKAEEFLRELD